MLQHKQSQQDNNAAMELVEMSSEPLYVEYTVKKKIDITPEDSFS